MHSRSQVLIVTSITIRNYYGECRSICLIANDQLHYLLSMMLFYVVLCLLFVIVPSSSYLYGSSSLVAVISAAVHYCI